MNAIVSHDELKRCWISLIPLLPLWTKVNGSVWYRNTSLITIIILWDDVIADKLSSYFVDGDGVSYHQSNKSSWSFRAIFSEEISNDDYDKRRNGKKERKGILLIWACCWALNKSKVVWLSFANTSKQKAVKSTLFTFANI